MSPHFRKSRFVAALALPSLAVFGCSGVAAGPGNTAGTGAVITGSAGMVNTGGSTMVGGSGGPGIATGGAPVTGTPAAGTAAGGAPAAAGAPAAGAPGGAGSPMGGSGGMMGGGLGGPMAGAGGAMGGAGGAMAGAGGTSAAGSGGGEDFECVLPELPDAGSLTDLGMKLPDPFTFFDGTKVTTKAQWECRRKEILAMAAKYLYGPVPGDCDEVSGSVSGGNISISCTVGGNTGEFSASISGSGNYIAVDLGSGILPGGHKSLDLGNNDGAIRSLYGLSELNPNIANGWMISRVMDVLEQNPDSGHDPTKIAVSGCSGCGKGAFLAGVFSRVPMTVIVESGGGGGTSWRMTQYYRSGQGDYQCGMTPQGIDNLEDSGICGPWVTSAASSFRSNPATVNNMPFDQHMLLATIAPRYLVHFTNDHGPNSWCHLAGTSEALASWAAHAVYNALGIPENHSFEIYSGGHCGVGDTGIAAAMFDRAFNGNMSADTGQINIMDSRLQMPVGEWPATWIDWDMETVLQ